MRDVVRLTLKDMDGIIELVTIWGEQCHLKVVKDARVRKDILVITSVQHDRLQGFSTTRK